MSFVYSLIKKKEPSHCIFHNCTSYRRRGAHLWRIEPTILANYPTWQVNSDPKTFLLFHNFDKPHYWFLISNFKIFWYNLRFLPMRTVFANKLIRENAFKDMLEHGLTVDLLQILVNLIGHWNEEVKSVLLLSHVDLLAPHAKRLPETLRYVVLELALFQMCKHVLQLPKHTRLAVDTIRLIVYA